MRRHAIDILAKCAELLEEWHSGPATWASSRWAYALDMGESKRSFFGADLLSMWLCALGFPAQNLVNDYAGVVKIGEQVTAQVAVTFLSPGASIRYLLPPTLLGKDTTHLAVLFLAPVGASLALLSAADWVLKRGNQPGVIMFSPGDLGAWEAKNVQGELQEYLRQERAAPREPVEEQPAAGPGGSA